MIRSAARVAGFTLLEMLVALAIFALLSVMSYGGMRSVLNQRVATEAVAERLGELQKIYLLMQRDLEQAVARGVRAAYGDSLPPMQGADNLQFTRAGWNNPLARPRSSLQRVGYALVNDRLTRYVWYVLDRAQDTQPLEQPLTEQVTRLSFRFLTEGKEWVTQWPEASTLVTGAPPPVKLPLAVEVTLDHKEYGELVWLFRMPAS